MTYFAALRESRIRSSAKPPRSGTVGRRDFWITVRWASATVRVVCIPGYRNSPYRHSGIITVKVSLVSEPDVSAMLWAGLMLPGCAQKQKPR